MPSPVHDIRDPEVRLDPIALSEVPELADKLFEYLLRYRCALFAGHPDDWTIPLRREVEGLIAESRENPLHTILCIRRCADHRTVGRLWYRKQDASTGLGSAFLMWLEIDPPFRRRRYATAALRLLKRRLLTIGIDSLGLEVYADNVAARMLYDTLDFRVAREIRHLALQQGSAEAGPSAPSLMQIAK